MPRTATLDTEKAVRHRYSQAACSKEPALCCPAGDDPRYLEVIPEEILERDYRKTIAATAGACGPKGCC